MKNCRQIFILLLLWSLCHLSHASDASDTTLMTVPKSTLEQIQSFLDETQTAMEAEGFRSDYNIGNYDPLIVKKSCDQALSLEFNKPPKEQNHLTLKVACEGHSPWRFYLSLKFNLYGEVLVASRNIVRNQVIESEDISTKEVIINKFNTNFYNRTKDLIGMIAKRSIRGGSEFSPNLLKKPTVVKRGDNVIIIAKSSMVSVKMTGTALTDGMKGQQIPVRNEKSKRVVKARVQEPGLVTITL